jgi:hypothetical protein
MQLQRSIFYNFYILKLFTIFNTNIRLCKSHIEELPTVSHIGAENYVSRLFYTTVHTLMMDQQRPKHVGVYVY